MADGVKPTEQSEVNNATQPIAVDNVANEPQQGVQQRGLVPMTLNVSEADVIRFQSLMSQFINAMSVAKTINNAFGGNPTKKVQPELPSTSSASAGLGCSKWPSVPLLKPKPEDEPSGCAKAVDVGKKVTDDAIYVKDSSSDERGKAPRLIRNNGAFFRPSYKVDSSDEDSDLPSLPTPQKLQNLVDDSDELSEDFVPPIRKRKGINAKTKGKGKGKVSTKVPGKEIKLYRPRPTTDSSTDVDDPSPKKQAASKKRDMLKAVAAFFSKDKDSKKRKKEESGESSDSTPKKQRREREDPHRGCCSVCLDNPPNGLLSCKHLYCVSCCAKMRARKQPCPKCGNKFRTWEVVFL